MTISRDTQGRTLTRSEALAARWIGAAVAALGLLGFANSFRNVAHAAAPSFGTMAWSVPAGIDVGIAVFSALDLLLARLDMRPAWVRLVPWALTGATIYLNVAEEATAFGRVAHALLPALWVLAVEVGTHVVRVRAHLSNERRMDRVRTSRWLLAPRATASLWRRMVLWEIRSYPTALDRERQRLLARAELADKHGVIAWRWRAPRRTRVLYRIGELTPYTMAGGTLPGAGTSSDGSAGRGAPGTSTKRRTATRTRKRPVNAPRYATEAELQDAARTVNRTSLAEHGHPAGVKKLRDELGVGQERATLLRDWLAIDALGNAAPAAPPAAVEQVNGTDLS